MPYKDQGKQRRANRDAMRRRRARDRAEQMRSAMVVLPSGELGLPDAPGEDELVRLLGMAARAGNVTAIRLLLTRLDLEHPEQTQPSLISSLAQRRAQRQRSKGTSR